MLNEVSQQGIRNILSEFDDNNLFSLASTVTQGLLKNKLETREGAINAIITYSVDADSILKRKIITRDVLFNYLHKNNLTIQLPATKNDIVKKIIEFWDSTEVCTTTVEATILTNADSDAAKTGTINCLAEQFSKWFYTMLNGSESIKPEHFYSDATFSINMFTNGEVITEQIQNDPQEISNRLFATKKRFHLFFNPNLTGEGVRGQVDPHGLVVVLACGTLHSNDTCVGVFEQSFALARDPQAENNWKIKNSELNLRSQMGVRGLPKLQLT